MKEFCWTKANHFQSNLLRMRMFLLQLTFDLHQTREKEVVGVCDLLFSFFPPGPFAPSIMLTIRKKLAEQAASGDSKPVTRGSQLNRKLSFRSQLLTAESSELGGVLPSKQLALQLVLISHSPIF